MRRWLRRKLYRLLVPRSTRARVFAFRHARLLAGLREHETAMVSAMFDCIAAVYPPGKALKGRG